MGGKWLYWKGFPQEMTLKWDLKDGNLWLGERGMGSDGRLRE